MRRRTSCEICGERAATEVELTSRRVALCRAHASVALGTEMETVDQLRSVFLEPDGRRALLARRATDERRLFPPRPEGRRHDDGRRRADRKPALHATKS